MTRSAKQNPRQLDKFPSTLEKLAKRADELELRLPNGAIVGSILGAIVEDLRP